MRGRGWFAVSAMAFSWEGFRRLVASGAAAIVEQLDPQVIGASEHAKLQKGGFGGVVDVEGSREAKRTRVRPTEALHDAIDLALGRPAPIESPALNEDVRFHSSDPAAELVSDVVPLVPGRTELGVSSPDEAAEAAVIA
jgi:hypothetical protein